MIKSQKDLFIEAINIDAQSLHERSIANFIRQTLNGYPITIIEDSTSKKIGGDCGNLICIPQHFDKTQPSIALFAHMDTPRPTINVRPIITDEKITSDGTTILGVDNRAGLSVLLNLLRELKPGNTYNNFIVVFTVAEEIGLFGSQHVDLSPYNVQFGFVFDCSKRPGTYIRSAVGCSIYQAHFIGRASHAAVAPEKGVNAIHIAAKALSLIKIGRLSPTMTSNAGMITGGTATNVVPDKCTVHGEVRSFDPSSINCHLKEIEKTFKTVAEENNGNLEFESQIDFAPFSIKPDTDIMKFTSKVMCSIGLESNPIEYLGGSDANMLNAKGIPTINLGIGAQNPHGNDEFILIEDLNKSSEIALALITSPQLVPSLMMP